MAANEEWRIACAVRSSAGLHIQERGALAHVHLRYQLDGGGTHPEGKAMQFRHLPMVVLGLGIVLLPGLIISGAVQMLQQERHFSLEVVLADGGRYWSKKPGIAVAAH
jgi:hypothetical protein